MVVTSLTLITYRVKKIKVIKRKVNIIYFLFSIIYYYIDNKYLNLY